MRLFFTIILLTLLSVACSNNLDLKNSNYLVKVKNKVLYRTVLEENIPAGLSKEDSIIAAESFIRSWINDVLLYDIAQKNFNDKDKVDLLVENYRKSLMIYQYQEQLVNERLTREIDEQSLYDYYNQNKDKLKLERPLIKGLFLKVPVNAPQVEEIRKLYKLSSSVSRDRLESYSLNNAVIFDFFTDKWTDFYDLVENFPKEQMRKEDLTANKKTLEREDSGYYYFLNITDFLLPGDNAPFEYVKTTVYEILINQRRINFLKKTEEELFNRELAKGEIQFFYE